MAQPDGVTDIIIAPAADARPAAPRGNCYTVENGGARPSIPSTKGMIWVGEEGRGRLLTRVPVPAGADVDVQGSVTRIPTETETDVVVLIRDHSGYRGEWSLHPARSAEWWMAFVRRAAAHRPPEGHGPINAATGHSEPAFGGITDCPICKDVPMPATDTTPFAELPGVRLVARGARAQGIAGAMGGGDEYLLVLAEGAALEIRRRGRLYGAPSVVRIANIAGQLVVSNPRDEATTAIAARPVW